ncbi:MULTISPECIES: glycoside hydrolase family 6 protein [unclassified Mycolicibacterium]|uniref:glycoside hydrolase family 6 protein n=1 Tax=unclassified Mycolicibacterium TaxID=2636767 RepID=UPI0012DF362A|nr:MULTISPECIES: glycoside hydrolase family 6 protein [unclassified Mycolicibacterium]MUL82203.1 1,4-beta-glucanase [Mycolicibacterium sp. CBMA 329]MUL87969.1 1,4-beta-glucanase [Mycolicibacterium sp. CBMA 331]MUM02300.1 1,4-beta-glucanase [Mycolicibacterium sp. CBMA 334]MUM26388.1 1,4-beta-glucanase [Mycolicibacterium sp. CBMA 295]MUM38266.1 1,4-beta-glucanase [Mycolicibacterium sp. CBMA 247]
MSSAVGAVARSIAPFLTVASVVAVGLAAAPAPAVHLVSDSNPLEGHSFYVNPSSKAMRAAQGNPSPELTAIANTPTAYWMDNVSSLAVDAKYIAAAQAAGTMPILALYGIPHRDCGSFAAGGFGSAGAYKGWIDGVAAAIGSGPAAVILEPDALAMADCLSADQRQERLDLMSYAVDTLTRNPATALYVDAGHSRWVSAEKMAGMLNQVGIAKARGFSLNTANFFTTAEEVGYGDAISGQTGGKPYVIDTSRNGAGPADGEMYWCNPSGRALGAAPTTATGNGNVDAFLWVKRPGESDGSCGTGEASAGTFVSQYAIDLTRNAGR